MKNNIILVNKDDKEIGTGEKLEVHKSGKLHRAFSIFVFNSKGELLIQKRATSKYHSGGLWSNTCCSHPRPNEDMLKAARRRLKEEIGIECDLKEIYSFVYRTEFENGLTEHEFNHIFVGKSDDSPVINPKEAEDWKWIDSQLLNKNIKSNPDKYTYWFKISLDDVLKKISG